MRFIIKENALIARNGNETIEVRAWGTNALRVRVTQYPQFTGKKCRIRRCRIWESSDLCWTGECTD